jgi:hypothetical protein
VRPDLARFHGPPRLDQVPPAPRRPSAEARRLVFAYQGQQAVMRIVGILFLLVGLALLVGLGWNVPADVAIAVGGARATGAVRATEKARSEKILGQRPWYVTYDYQVGGVTLTDRRTVLSEPPARGAPIEIEYATARPQWSRWAGTTRNAFGWGWGILPGLVVAALGASSMLAAVRSNRREVRAFVHGHPVLARVTFRGEDLGTELNRRHPWVLRWEFRSPTGEVVPGSISSMDASELEAFATAEEVVVLYDPGDPRCSTLYVP